MDLLRELRTADFNWVVKTDDVWKASVFDIPEINGRIRRELVDEIEDYSDSGTSPLGWMVVGPGGAGKTHLLRAIRRKMVERGHGFLMVDLTGINDFWETTLLQCIDSLQKPFDGYIPQYQMILEHIMNMLSQKKQGKEWVEKLAVFPRKKLLGGVKQIIDVLAKKHRIQLQKNHDVIRALILLNSTDFSLSNIGYSWLQGLGIDPREKERFGFATDKKKPVEIVEALCWVMSLRGPFVLAFDQMDSIVMEHHLMASAVAGEEVNEEQQRSQSIIEGLAGGLSALVHSVGGSNARVVVTCLETTWNILRGTVSKNEDRFYPAKVLKTAGNVESARFLVEARLRQAYEKAGIAPEHPTFPFKPESFDGMDRLFAREILKLCDQHRNKCVKEGDVRELDSFVKKPIDPVIGPPPERIVFFDDKLSELKKQADTDELLDEQNEDTVLGGGTQDLGRLASFGGAEASRFFRLGQIPSPGLDPCLVRRRGSMAFPQLRQTRNRVGFDGRSFGISRRER